MSYHPYRTDGSYQSSELDGMPRLRACRRSRAPQALRSSEWRAANSKTRRLRPASSVGRPSMNGSAAAVAYLILAVFLGGIAVGVVTMVAIAVRKEDQLYSLSGAAPGAAAMVRGSSVPQAWFSFSSSPPPSTFRFDTAPTIAWPPE